MAAHIAIGICLGLRACALELGKERVPTRVRLPKPLLEHRAGVDVALPAVHLLLFDDPSIIIGGNRLGRTDKDTSVELEDVPIYLGFRQNAAQRHMVQSVDVLGYKGTNDAGVLQGGEREMGWVG